MIQFIFNGSFIAVVAVTQSSYLNPRHPSTDPDPLCDPIVMLHIYEWVNLIGLNGLKMRHVI